MNNLSDIDSKYSNERIAIEAASWVAQLDGNRLSTSDRLALAEWLSRSPKHSDELKKLAQFWGGLDQLIDQAILDNRQTSVSQFIKAWMTLRPSHFLTAVGTLLVMVVSLFFYSSQPISSSQLPNVLVFDVKKGEELIQTLDDGSVIHLNTDTVVEVLYSESTRTVRLLRGQVYFDVAKDVSRPFEVFVGDSHIVAVGTEFDIRLNDSEVDVVVTEGRIRFDQIVSEQITNKQSTSHNELPISNSFKQPLIVDAGHSIKVDEVPTIIKTDQQMLAKQVAWRKGELLFVNSPLVEVVSELSRYNNIDITMQPELRDLKIGGRFLTTDVDRILKALEMSANIDVQRHADGAIFLASR